jgi:hypothetical protein
VSSEGHDKLPETQNYVESHTADEVREEDVWGQPETKPMVQQNPGVGQAVRPRGRPRKQAEPAPTPQMPQVGGGDLLGSLLLGPAQCPHREEEALISTSGMLKAGLKTRATIPAEG